jgi:hypothetical protein
MVYKAQNDWVYRLCPSFRKMDLFSSSGEGREIPTLLDPLETVYLFQNVF